MEATLRAARQSDFAFDMKLALRILLLLAIAGIALWAVQRYREPTRVAVVLAEVERGRVESTVTNTRAGTVKACRRSKLSPAAGGQVSELSVREGDRVTREQVLMVIWNEDLEAGLSYASSQVLAAEAKVEEACLEAQIASREADRLQRLAQRSAVAEDRVDRATTDAAARKAGCRGATAAVEIAKAEVAAARAALERTVLRAPFDGIVAEVNAEFGEYVTPSPVGIPTPPAVDLIDDSCLYITAPIDEVDAPAIRTRMPACVELDAFADRRCSARVRRIAPYVLDVEKQSRTVEVEVELTDPKERADLLPGYSADVEIVLARRQGVLRVPTEAVLEGNRVLVYGEPDGRLEARAFDAGLSNWRFTEVRSGLEAGERVVVSIGREGVEAGAFAVPQQVAFEP